MLACLQTAQPTVPSVWTGSAAAATVWAAARGRTPPSAPRAATWWTVTVTASPCAHRSVPQEHTWYAETVQCLSLAIYSYIHIVKETSNLLKQCLQDFFQDLWVGCHIILVKANILYGSLVHQQSWNCRWLIYKMPKPLSHFKQPIHCLIVAAIDIFMLLILHW